MFVSNILVALQNDQYICFAKKLPSTTSYVGKMSSLQNF